MVNRGALPLPPVLPASMALMSNEGMMVSTWITADRAVVPRIELQTLPAHIT